MIPKAARDIFDLKSGDRLIVLGDEKEGIALVKAEEFEKEGYGRQRSWIREGCSIRCDAITILLRRRHERYDRITNRSFGDMERSKC